jgi:asparagine synthase (glutamine-hydrolysing)
MSGICGLFGERHPNGDVRTIAGAMWVEGESIETKNGANGSVGLCKRWSNQLIEEYSGLLISADLDLISVRSLQASVQKHQSISDLNNAQLIAAEYRKNGSKVLDQLEGSFSIAIWDPEVRKGFLAVDRVGAKTVFWSNDGSRLIFASRPGGVAELVGREQNPEALVQYLLLSVVPAPLSAFRGVHRLEPGYFMTWEQGTEKLVRYWDMKYQELRGKSEAEWASQTREQLRGAVHRTAKNLQANETGAYLSGGTDSSSVTAFLSEVQSPARTYSIYLEDKAYSEIEFARTAAGYFKTDHHDECLSPDHALEAFEKLTTFYDEPFANTSAIGGYFCALMARRTGVNTLLAGDGGDEIFGGNERYASDKKFSIYHDLPNWIKRFGIVPASKLVPKVGKLSLISKYIARASQPNPRRILSYNNLLATPPEAMLSQDVLDQVPVSKWLDTANRHFASAHADSELNRLLYMDVKITLADNDLRKVSGTAELAGVQVRYPMLDRGLMEFTGTIPTHLKLKGKEKRYIFKQAMKPILPQVILQKKKHGFGIPISLWLLKDPRMNQLLNDVMHDSKTRQRGFFAPKLIDDLLTLHRSAHAGYYGEFLWYVLMFEMWCRQHLNSKPIAAVQGN